MMTANCEVSSESLLGQAHGLQQVGDVQRSRAHS